MRKKFFYCLFLILFAVYLLSINFIILIGENKPIMLQGGVPSIDKSPVTGHIDYQYPLNDLLERVYFSGWVFAEAEKPYINREKGIVFIDEKNNAFLCTTDNFGGRPDAYALHKGMGKKINDFDLGFGISFSVMNLKEGKYLVGIYCRENDDCYGYTLTDIVLTKDGNNIHLGLWQSETVKLHKSSHLVSGSSKANIDIVSKENELLEIHGWGFIPEQDPIENDTYVLITYGDGSSQAYSTKTSQRPDLVTAFGDEMYKNAGFYAKIPTDQLHSDDFSVTVLIEDENGLHTSPEMYTAVQSGIASMGTSAAMQPVESSEPSFMDKIVSVIAIPLNALMKLCYNFTNSYVLAIIVFTLLTKIILFPVSMWTQRNGIKMVEIMPAINELKLQYYGDKETIAEETQKLYKKVKYHPLASSVPLIIQIVLLMGVIEAVRNMIGTDTASVYARIPSQAGGLSLLMPVAAAFASLCLGITQNYIGPLQREQDKKEQFVTNAISVCISLFLGAFVSIGTCVYWIASNLLSVPNQFALNIAVNPKKYIDYDALNDSREKLKEYDALSVGVTKEDKRREKKDYKRFFSIANKHLVFYSESSGFYKYFKNIIEHLLAHSNIIIHYVTNDPKDQIFRIAESQPRIKPYYIGKQKTITLFMKMDADIIVMTTPDLDNFYLKRSYVRKDIEYIYVPHGVGSTNMTTRKGAYDNFDTFLCTGQHQEDELRETERMYNLKPKNLVPCGYGVLDQLLESYNKQKYEPNARPRVLIAPSWQEDNILDSCIDPMLDELLKKDYQVVVRPHPEYVKRYRPRMEAIIARYQSWVGENLSFETDFSSNFNVFASDVVITDWSGIAYEFSFCTKRPTLFINTKMKIFNPDYDKYSKPAMDITSRDEIGVSLNPKDMSRINNLIDDMLENKDDYAKKIGDYMDENMFCLGNHGKAGARYILKQLKARTQKK